MFEKTSLLFANFLFWISSIPNAIRFLISCGLVENTQRKILAGILKKNYATAYGQKHGFESVKEVRHYQSSVPINSYEDLLPFIGEAARGTEKVLTEDPLILFEPTSGSTSASKLIPYVKGLRHDFRKGLDSWIFYLYIENPKLFSGSVYWSLTPSQNEKKQTEGGIPIGFAEDEEYFGKIQQWVINTITAVPKEVKKIRDLDSFRYVTLLFLLTRRDLRLISVWNPTYLSLILDELPRHAINLIEDIESGRIRFDLPLDVDIRQKVKHKLLRDQARAEELKAILVHRGALSPYERDACGKTLYEEIWPELVIISCWRDGTAVSQIEGIRKLFPQVKIQPKGLLATEAFVSFPFLNNNSVLSIRSHFFEFENPADGKISLAHELKIGKQYKVIVTTSGGLYRYALGDIIEIVGFWQKAPVIRFIGRGDHVVDLVGEKLNATFVDQSINRLLDELGIRPVFWLLAPEKITDGPYRYILFIELPQKVGEESLEQLGEATDKVLRENYHYDYARRLGQLASIGVFLIKPDNNGSSDKLFLETCYRLGQQLGAIKLTRLHRYEDWIKEFPGSMLITNP